MPAFCGRLPGPLNAAPRMMPADVSHRDVSHPQEFDPPRWLRGEHLQSILPSYLELSMDNFTRQQEQFRKQFSSTFGAAPGAAMFDEQVRQNVAMFERAMKMFSPFAYAPTGQPAETKPEPKAEPSTPANPLLEAQAAALEQMRRQMEEMQAQLARLSGAPKQ